jgi:hypothetical protein
MEAILKIFPQEVLSEKIKARIFGELLFGGGKYPSHKY